MGFAVNLSRPKEIVYQSEPAYTEIGFCDRCGENLFSDEETWQIGKKVYCGQCIEKIERAERLKQFLKQILNKELIIQIESK